MNINNYVIGNYIQQALKEDIYTGDITTDSIIPSEKFINVSMNSREDFIICGLNVVKKVFNQLDSSIKINFIVNEGDYIKKNQTIAKIEGSARSILTGERTALNFIQRMSAIATVTNKYQQAIKPFMAKITDTRKTTPNFRLFEKHAVKIGGGSCHRFGLFDCVMIKDNHIQTAGSITQAVNSVRQNLSHTTKIEVETENIEMVKEALDLSVDIIMLDNMSIAEMKEAVQLIKNQAIVEASGNITLKTINEIASIGVDYISTSAITTTAGIVDIGLDF